MATEEAPKRTRRLRVTTETVRDRTTANSEAPRTVKPNKVRTGLRSFGNLAIWKPFKVVGRFLSKYLIPPYFKNSWRELKMVTWPSGKQTRDLTMAVILFSIVFGAIVAIVDFGLDKLFKKVILNI
ncbi:MAG: preprotein translocase subunit SecE [Candidatus Saccharimonadales bacterium]